jgi:hypothetical protein
MKPLLPSPHIQELRTALAQLDSLVEKAAGAGSTPINASVDSAASAMDARFQVSACQQQAAVLIDESHGSCDDDTQSYHTPMALPSIPMGLGLHASTIVERLRELSHTQCLQARMVRFRDEASGQMTAAEAELADVEASLKSVSDV